MRKGINYDIGTVTRGTEAPSSRDIFDPAIVQREMEIIKNDLHCDSVRISGQDITRLKTAAEFALQQGLEVWLSPAMIDATEEETLLYFIECAKMAEKLRIEFPHIIFVTGCELTFFMKGLVEGETAFDRVNTFMKPWFLLKSAILRGPFNKRLNSFLSKATAAVRENFHGQLTYSSGPWEKVDWSMFDLVGVDYYRDSYNQKNYRTNLKKYFKFGKPVVILEFGCCTYQGAENRGGYGWAIVDPSQTPMQLKGDFVRDEKLQADYIIKLLKIFKEEKVYGAFVFTFVSPTYPYHENPLYDLDMASFSVVKSYPDQKEGTYKGMPWDPKKSFYALGEYFSTLS